MKLFTSAILSAVLLFSLSACENSSSGAASKNQPQPKTSDKKSNPSNSSTGSTQTPASNHNGSKENNGTTSNPSTGSTQTPSSNKSGSNENNGTEESFYGQWQIKKVIASGIGTYSSDDFKTLTGKTLTFSKESATCFGDKIEDMNNTAANPVYKKTVIAKNDFSADFRVPFEQLGITGDSVTEVDATGTKGICTVFFITPDSKIILYGGGTFFELDKVSNQNDLPSSDEQAINRPTGAWVDTFEKQLYKGYHVTPIRYKSIGNGYWEVWVKEVDTGKYPYVTVNQNTGEFHG